MLGEGLQVLDSLLILGMAARAGEHEPHSLPGSLSVQQLTQGVQRTQLKGLVLLRAELGNLEDNEE